MSLWTASPKIGLQNMNTIGYQPSQERLINKSFTAFWQDRSALIRLGQEQGQLLAV